MSENKNLDLKYGFTEEDYKKYADKKRGINNEMLRRKGQTFADAMCEDTIVAGFDKNEGERILEAIKKSGG